MTPLALYFLSSIILFLPFLSASHSVALDSLIRDYAFQALKNRTDVLYQVQLPANFSGITASVVRVRTSSLWSRGLDSDAFHVPARTVAEPNVERVVMVYQDLGNWSATYYNISGYRLASKVVGCLAYDAKNGSREVKIKATEDRMSVILPKERENSTVRCVRVSSDGVVHLGGMTSSSVCSSRGIGHFAVVVPLAAPAPEMEVVERGRRRRWWVWVVVGVGGVAGLLIVGVVGAVAARVVRGKEREGIEVHAESGENVGGEEKVTAAAVLRTLAEIEDGDAAA